MMKTTKCREQVINCEECGRLYDDCDGTEDYKLRGD